MVTSKTESCTCVECQCDPCECKGGACSNTKSCSSSWCNWGTALRIAIGVGLVVAAFATGIAVGSHGQWDRDGGRGGYSHDGKMMMSEQMGGKKDKMAEHCQMMPEMAGCERYQTQSTQMMDMSHDPMSMSMADMGQMMAGKTGDALDKAFLEGMIPHHQGAVDMAKMLAGSKHPELVKFGADIIATQQKEIDQMNTWMKEWGYSATGTTNSGNTMSGMHMMPDGTMMMGM